MKKAQPTEESRKLEAQPASAAESAATESVASGQAEQDEDATAALSEGQNELLDAPTTDEPATGATTSPDVGDPQELQAEPEEAEAEEEEFRAEPEEPLADGEDADQPMLPHVLPSPTERRALLEAVVYVAEEPVSAEQIAEALGMPLGVVNEDLEQLAEETRSAARGVEIRKVAGGYKMFTKAEHHEGIRGFVKTLRPKLRLSLPALETLAVVAYKQPVTVPEIQAIRGVNAGGVIHTLLNHKLITTAGRKKVIGRPMQYKTTKEFLVQFGLNDLSELPNLKELEELSRAALGEGEETAESAAPRTEAGAASGNGAGIVDAEQDAVEEALLDDAADDLASESAGDAPEDLASDDEGENSSSPIVALGAAVGGGGFVSPRFGKDSEEDPEA